MSPVVPLKKTIFSILGSEEALIKTMRINIEKNQIMWIYSTNQRMITSLSAQPIWGGIASRDSNHVARRVFCCLSISNHSVRVSITNRILTQFYQSVGYIYHSPPIPKAISSPQVTLYIFSNSLINKLTRIGRFQRFEGTMSPVQNRLKVFSLDRPLLCQQVPAI